MTQPRYQSPEVEETRERLIRDLVETRAIVVVIPYESGCDSVGTMYPEGSTLDMSDALARLLLVTDELFGSATKALARSVGCSVVGTRSAIEEAAGNYRSVLRAAEET